MSAAAILVTCLMGILLMSLSNAAESCDKPITGSDTSVYCETISNGKVCEIECTAEGEVLDGPSKVNCTCTAMDTTTTAMDTTTTAMETITTATNFTTATTDDGSFRKLSEFARSSENCIWDYDKTISCVVATTTMSTMTSTSPPTTELRYVEWDMFWGIAGSLIALVVILVIGMSYILCVLMRGKGGHPSKDTNFSHVEIGETHLGNPPDHGSNNKGFQPPNQPRPPANPPSPSQSGIYHPAKNE